MADLAIKTLAQRLIGDFNSFLTPTQQQVEGALVSIPQGVLTAIDALRNSYQWASDPAHPALPAYDGARRSLLNTLDELVDGEQGVRAGLLRLRALPGLGLDGLQRGSAQMQEAYNAVEVAIRSASAAVLSSQYFVAAEKDDVKAKALQALGQVLDDLRDAVNDCAATMQSALEEPFRPWLGGFSSTAAMGWGVNTELAAVQGVAAKLMGLRWRLATGTRAGLYADLESLLGPFDTFLAAAQPKLDDTAPGSVAAFFMTLAGFGDATHPAGVRVFDASVTNIYNAVQQAIAKAADWDDVVKSVTAVATGTLANELVAVVQNLQGLVQWLDVYIGEVLTLLAKYLLADANALLSELGDAVTAARALLDTLRKITYGPALLRELQLLEQGLGHAVDQLAKAVQLGLPDAGPVLSDDGLLRLMRAFGEPPRLPDLSFALPNAGALLGDLPRCGYYFLNFVGNELLGALPHVDLSPLRAFASQLLDSVKSVDPLRLHFPTTSLTDRLVAPDLSNFNLSDVFHNWGGLELSHLFPNLKLPAISNDNVRLTHGEEYSTRSAWLQVDADVPFNAQPIDVFSLAGIVLRLRDARFRGSSRMQAQASGAMQQTTQGSILGDWDLSIGGFPIVVLEQCGLTYTEGGKLQFEVSPAKVKPQAVLAFVADLLAKVVPEGSGVTTAVSNTGVSTTLELPLPDIQFGTFGISSLSLGFFFGIDFSGEFTLRTGVHLARRNAPAALTIFILGGAFCSECDVAYTPGTGVFTASVAVAVFASASLAVSLGPISGGIYAYFGISAQFVAATGSSSALTMSVLIVFRGQVSLLGFLTVGLCLSLEAGYTAGTLYGRGTVTFNIKIGWFINIHVSESVGYTFGAAGGSHAQLSDQVAQQHAEAHEDMF